MYQLVCLFLFQNIWLIHIFVVPLRIILCGLYLDMRGESCKSKVELIN